TATSTLHVEAVCVPPSSACAPLTVTACTPDSASAAVPVSVTKPPAIVWNVFRPDAASAASVGAVVSVPWKPVPGLVVVALPVPLPLPVPAVAEAEPEDEPPPLLPPPLQPTPAPDSASAPARLRPSANGKGTPCRVMG